MIRKTASLFIHVRVLVIAALLAGAMLALRPVPVAHGAMYTVNTTSDEFNTNAATCSLREALYAANYNVAISGCPAGSATGGDTIVLANGATYYLFRAGNDDTGILGDLDILDNEAGFDLWIYVAGGGTASIHQNANPDDRVLDIHGAYTSVVISGITMRYGVTGASGGGIYNEGRLTLTNVHITANHAYSGGGIISSGRLTVRGGSLIDFNFADDQGGGINNYFGYLAVTENSSVSNNVANLGGGIFNTGEALLDSASIVTNDASRGAGVFHTTPYYTLTIRNHTHLFDNYSSIDGGGLEVAQGDVFITDSEFLANLAPNGSAIFNQLNGGPISMTGSCIKGNNNVAVVNDASTTLTATGNWWGASNGPGPVGPGSGDRISSGVAYWSVYQWWLTTRPSFCSP